MKLEKMTTKKEIYICNFQRETGESCAQSGAKELTDELKKWAKQERPDVKVIRGGCLGKCSEGIAIACYPERELLLNVKKVDIEEIKKGLY